MTYIAGELVTTKRRQPSSPENMKRINNTTTSPINATTELKQPPAATVILGPVLVETPAKSPWLQRCQGKNNEAEDEFNNADYPQLLSQISSSWGQYEMLEKAGSRFSFSEIAPNNSFESKDIVEDDEMDDNILIFQIELWWLPFFLKTAENREI